MHTCCIVQGRVASPIGDADVCLGTEQRLDGGQPIEADRNAKRCDASSILQAPLCSS